MICQLIVYYDCSFHILTQYFTMHHLLTSLLINQSLKVLATHNLTTSPSMSYPFTNPPNPSLSGNLVSSATVVPQGNNSNASLSASTHGNLHGQQYPSVRQTFMTPSIQTINTPHQYTSSLYTTNTHYRYPPYSPFIHIIFTSCYHSPHNLITTLSHTLLPLLSGTCGTLLCSSCL